MLRPERLINIDAISDFFLQLSHGDAAKENEIKIEFVNELKEVEMILIQEMDKRNWEVVKNTIVRLHSVFHMINEPYIIELISSSPDVTSANLNRVQKDETVEEILKLLTYLIKEL